MPNEKESVTVVRGQDEEALIDLGDEDGGVGAGEPTPGDKLRKLLNLMDAEIRQATPVALQAPVEEVKNGRGGWRDGRRTGSAKAEEGLRSRSPSPPPSPKTEDESPPTPPPRITRTFLKPGRRVSGERKSVFNRVWWMTECEVYCRSEKSYSSRRGPPDIVTSSGLACE